MCECRAVDGLSGQVSREARGEGVGFDTEGGEADTVDCDAIACIEPRGEHGRGDGDAGCAFSGRYSEERAGGFDQASEHEYRVQGSGFRVAAVSCRGWPRVVQVAGDAGVWPVADAGDPAEGLLEEVRRGDSLSEGDCLVAQLGLGVDEDGLVDQVLAEEGTVEVRAALEEEAENVALGEGGEDGGKAESASVAGDLVDLDAE